MPATIATRIAEWLRHRQCPQRGVVVDSVHQLPGTYADGFSALAFAGLGWNEARDRALQVSLRRPEQSEFDSLAQSLLLHLWPETVGERLRQLLETRSLFTGRALVSNNWALFRALTRELRGKSADYRLKGLQLPSGLYPDSPIGMATPSCYHAKICAVLSLRACLLGVEDEGLRRGLEALMWMVSPGGYLLPYGRSRNTLFGQASAYLALRLAASRYNDGRYAWCAQRLLDRLGRFQATDGHVPAVLNDQEWLRHDWDVYINNPDYNAFAAASLLLAERLAPEQPAAQTPPTGTCDLGPFLVSRHDSGYFACSLGGEYAPFGSPFFCDTRYAGMVPLLFDEGARSHTFDAGYCWDGRDVTRATLVDPRVSPWIPFYDRNCCRYWVRHFDRLRWAVQKDTLEVIASGRATFSRPTSRWSRFWQDRCLRRAALQMKDRDFPERVEVQLSFRFSERRVAMQASGSGPLRQSYQEEVLCTESR